MSPRDLVYVGHMLDMARKAVSKTRGLSRKAYDADENLRLALIHLIQVIGEAARQVSREFSGTHPEIPWADIIGMRHKVVHDYLGVDEDIVSHLARRSTGTSGGARTTSPTYIIDEFGAYSRYPPRSVRSCRPDRCWRHGRGVPRHRHNLKRQVAIKVLPASVAGDAERLARFQREAEVLAALNHPNIASIYGLERSAR